jgi:glycosyltransferase involved in cell wall biosynthesis
MKIVFTTDTIQRGGKERQIFILTSKLLESGYEVVIISLKNADNSYAKEYKIPEEYILIISEKRKLDKLISINRELEKLNPDIVMSWDAQTALYSLIISKKLKFKFINASVQHGIRLKKYSHYIRSIILWLSPYRLGNSRAGLIANNLNPEKRNNFILYNGIEAVFSAKYLNNDIIKFRNELFPELDANRKFFVAVANFVPFKDYFTLLKALAKYKKDGNKFYLIALGDGPMRSLIVKEITRLDLDQEIILKGRVSNVESYLRISDIYLHSSRGEGVSNAILEAMFCGLPVISSNVGGVPETVLINNGSLLFEYKNVDMLYNHLIKSDHLIKTFDSESVIFQNHLRKFVVNSMVNNFEKIISSIKR